MTGLSPAQRDTHLQDQVVHGIPGRNRHLPAAQIFKAEYAGVFTYGNSAAVGMIPGQHLDRYILPKTHVHRNGKQHMGSG